MKVFLYSGMQKMIEKSGVGRAIYHQKKAAAFNDIELVDNLKDADVVHINTIFPKSYELAKEAHKLGKKVVYHAHSTRQDFRNSYIGSNLVDGLFAWWIMKCYNSGDIIITPSIYSKKLLQSYGRYKLQQGWQQVICIWSLQQPRARAQQLYRQLQLSIP